MQRWIMIGVIVAALGSIGLLGGYKWLQAERANRPDKIWVPIPLNPELTHEQHTEFAEQIRAKLVTNENFLAIATDLALQKRWNHPHEQDCVDELHRRLIYEVGDHQAHPHSTSASTASNAKDPSSKNSPNAS